MTSTIINQEDYNVYQPKLLYGWEINFDDIPKDDICHTVMEIVERINIGKIVDLDHYDPRAYDPVMMFTAVALAYAEQDNPSLRDIERLCRYDIRYRFITQNQKPCYRSFQRFIQKLKYRMEDINKYIYLCIQDSRELEKTILYVDGTKFEANANKMTFFWGAWARKNYPKNWQKCLEIIRQLNNYFRKNDIDVTYSLIKKPDIGYILEIEEALDRWLESRNAVRKGRGLHPVAKLLRELKKAAVKLWEYMIAKDILGGRNSFSKVDPDATFMHMKYDYYNHTNVFKAGYNVQAGVCNGYVAHYYVSEDCNDINTYIPFMEGYKEKYGKYPEVTVADAGYGSFDNYAYSQLRGIEAVLKYPGYEKKKEKVNDRNRYHSVHFEKDENGVPVCPQGHAFTEKGCRVKEGIVPRITIYYQNEHCEGCPVRKECTKAKNGRKMQVTPQLERYHEKIDRYLESEEGKKHLDNRSSQAEGLFGDIKENHEFDRMKRRGIDNVKLEIGLVMAGHNIRAYHNKKQKLA